MTFRWYLRRLAAMSGPEIAHRLLEQAKRQISRRRAHAWSDFSSGRPARPLAGLAFVAMTPARRAAVREAADRVLAGDVAAFGIRWPTCAGSDPFAPDAWWLDPITGRRWPGREHYCFDISYRHAPAFGDIKYVWELNRLQVLQPLAIAYALFGDEAALAMIERIVASWMTANPPFRGLGWASGIEVALRAISLVIVVTFCACGLSASTRDALATMLRAHRSWLARFPSRYSSANNHRVAELVGLLLIDCSFDAQGASTARHLDALALEAARQILPDGAPAEQSPTYGAFTAELLVVALLVARAHGLSVDARIADRLERFADFVGTIADAGGQVPRIGDDDEGRGLTLVRAEQNYPASIARMIAGALARPCNFDWEGDEYREALVPTVPGRAAPQRTLVTFSHGGLTTTRWRAGAHAFQLVVDHGPLGYLALAAHGHADANAITLSLDDRPVLVDPGTYLYHAGGAWRDWFRGTRAHNTLTLDGQNQSTITGPFNWGRRARANLVDARDGEDWLIVTTHDGYCRRFGARHRRTVCRTDGGLAITDDLATDISAWVELSFQLADDLEARLSGRTCIVSRDGTDILAIAFDASGDVRLAKGADDRAGGWVSRRFGARTPAWRIAWTRAGTSPAITTTIRLLRHQISRPGHAFVDVTHPERPA